MSEWSSPPDHSPRHSRVINNRAWTETDHADETKEPYIELKRCYRVPRWFWWFIYGLVIGVLLAGIVLAVLLILWLKSRTSSMTGESTGNISTITSLTTTILTTIVTSITTASTSASSTTATTASLLCASWTWNATGTTVAGTGTAGSGPTQLNQPWNIYVDPSTDILYIADSQNHRIVKWLPNASSGTIIAGTGVAGAGATQLDTPRDVFVDSMQNIYVADANNDRIQFFPSGSSTGTTITTSWGTGVLYGLFVNSGSIYACDYTNGAVWKNGTIAAGNNGNGPALNQFNQPQDFTVDTSVNIGTMYVANTQQQTIIKWTPGASSGTIFAGTNGVRGSTSVLLNIPIAVRIDSYGNIFVVDNNNHRVQLYCQYPSPSSTANTIAGVTGTSGQTATLLNYPAGLALDSYNNLYVANTSNNRVQKFMRLS